MLWFEEKRWAGLVSSVISLQNLTGYQTRWGIDGARGAYPKCVCVSVYRCMSVTVLECSDDMSYLLWVPVVMSRCRTFRVQNLCSTLPRCVLVFDRCPWCWTTVWLKPGWLNGAGLLTHILSSHLFLWLFIEYRLCQRCFSEINWKIVESVLNDNVFISCVTSMSQQYIINVA